jgi:hypothetical protein
MAEIYTHGSATQGTGAPTTNPLLYPVARAYQGTSQACIVDLTPPTFAGVAALTIQSLGQIRASWATATDATNPIRYEVYIKRDNATNLFYPINIIAITDKLQFDIFNLPDSVLLGPGIDYYVGVKAVDAVGNRDNNLVNQTIQTSGISAGGGGSEYEIAGLFNVNLINFLEGTLWASVNEEVITSLPRLGTASYVIYDKNAAIVSGMSESGITPDANGQFTITPILSTLDFVNNFYTLKATIIVDGSPRSSYLPITASIDAASQFHHEPRGGFSINASNQLQGSLWMTSNGEHVTSGLGTASYTIYDKDSVSIGITESGITADAQGFFKITPVSASAILDLTHYVVKVAIVYNSQIHNGVLFIGVAE